MSDTLSLTGRLLIAMPDMDDPRFARSVVFLCEHSDDGAMGLIVNKPLDGVNFAAVLEQMEITPGAPRDVAVRFGGPVERQRGFVLHGDDYTSAQSTARIAPGFCLTATRDVLEALGEGAGPASCVLTLGYAGWAEGQLEREIAANGWLVGDADPALVFGEARAMWSGALARLGINPLLLSAEAGRA
ncbi:DUF179 domain-containing protein [Salipiger sp. IMCC34102]|uniref:YqgE/AlgH family protein n=1 Tax=Salipiger sp. IMCC34102 TaxID=2510647 RepID=UPI00101D2BC8|nr:YqgE/AlgH family protein [Salipiger sp. IMCC34102]RYH01392.1 DUF179 domain-containing protein [Salipiger sp. IMCC34102]